MNSQSFKADGPHLYLFWGCFFLQQIAQLCVPDVQILPLKPRQFTERSGVVYVVKIWVQTQSTDSSGSAPFVQSDPKPLHVSQNCSAGPEKFKLSAKWLFLHSFGVQHRGYTLGQLTSIMFSCFAPGIVMDSILKHCLCGLFSRWQESVCSPPAHCGADHKAICDELLIRRNTWMDAVALSGNTRLIRQTSLAANSWMKKQLRGSTGTRTFTYLFHSSCRTHSYQNTCVSNSHGCRSCHINAWTWLF